MSETHQSHTWFFTRHGARCMHCGCEMFNLKGEVTDLAKAPCQKSSTLSRPQQRSGE